MFQPAAKLEFIRRHCSPAAGWKVIVDIDASEEGNTGGERTTLVALDRRERMRLDAKMVRLELNALGAKVGGNRKAWFSENSVPCVSGDRDIIAFHLASKTVLVAEVEGESSAQPEQKLYKAIGQLVIAAGEAIPRDWQRQLVLVVVGDKMGAHLAKARELAKLGISGLQLTSERPGDHWIFGAPPSTAVTVVLVDEAPA